jgi:predicted  nucleic acid-binding Zn-ribbon protein
VSARPGTDLEALLALQAVDIEVDQCRHRRATLPERAELVALGAQLAGLELRLAAARAERDVVATRQEQMERTLEGVEHRAAEVKKRLYGGTVSATRELQAMAAELDSLTARASDVESQALEVMEQREPLDGRVEALEGEKGTVSAERVAVGDRLVVREAETDVELESIISSRADAAAAVPEELVAAYEQLRSRLDGVGVARLVGSRCGGCHLTLPATALDQLRHQSAGSISYCEQCGRILVPASHL